LDADDMIAPTMLERTVDVLLHEGDVAIACTDLQQFGESSLLIRAPEPDSRKIPQENQLNYCSLFRREVWETVGGYNPNMAFGYEDWDFWVGAFEHGYRALRVPEPLFMYRVTGGSRSSVAQRHAGELRRQIRLNHPASYAGPDPLVSVIIPTHNYAQYLPEALESVRAQSFTDWECIVVDDGSTDETAGVLERFTAQDARIRRVWQPQQGLAATRDRGLALTRGRYVQFLDSDDLLGSGKLSQHVEALDSAGDVDLVYGPTKYFDDGRKRPLRWSWRSPTA
jgi:GT2 family glycosyltransferase